MEKETGGLNSVDLVEHIYTIHSHFEYSQVHASLLRVSRALKSMSMLPVPTNFAGNMQALAQWMHCEMSTPGNP
jgi:hypothetical protein